MEARRKRQKEKARMLKDNIKMKMGEKGTLMKMVALGDDTNPTSGARGKYAMVSTLLLFIPLLILCDQIKFN